MPGAIEIGKVSVRVVPDTDEFASETRRAITAIEAVLDAVNVDVSISLSDAVEEAADALNAAQAVADRQPIRFRVNWDDTGDLERGMRDLENRLVDLGREEIEIDLSNADDVQDTLDSLREALHAIDNEAFSQMSERVERAMDNLKVDFDLDPSAGADLHRKIEQQLEKQDALMLQLEGELSEREKHEIERQVEQIDADIQVGIDAYNKKIVQAELKLLARRREVKFTPTLDNVAAAKVGATLAALSGGRALNNIGTDVADWIGGLDEALPKIATAGLLVANLSSVALTSTANLFSLAASVATVGQAGLALPGILGGIAVGLGATIAVLKDFNDRLPFVAERLHQMQDLMSDTFWEKAEGPFRALAHEILPLVEKGLVTVSDSLGTFFANLAGSHQGAFGEALTGMFDKLAESIDIAATFTDDFVGIIEKLGTLGADNLPALATWFGEISRDFNHWLGDQGTDGLQQFVDTGIDALQDLGAITRDTFATIASIARVAESTGASTLSTLRDTMASVRETVESPSFQHALRNAFTGAREGLEEFTDAAGGPFQRLLRRLARTFTEILPSAGRAGGSLLGGIFGALARPSIQNAIIGFFDSIESAVDDIVPALPGVADGLAGIIDVLSTLTEGVGDALGDALGFVGPAIADLAPHVEKLADELTDLLDNSIRVLGPAFEDIAHGAGVLADTLKLVIDPLNLLLDLIDKIPGGSEILGGIIAIGLTVGAATWLGAAVRNKIGLFGVALAKAGDEGYLASRKIQTAGRTIAGAADRITAKHGIIAGLGIAASVAADGVGLSNTAMGLMLGSVIPGYGTAIGASVGFIVDVTKANDAMKDSLEESNRVLTDASVPLDEMVAGLRNGADEFSDLQSSFQNPGSGGFGDLVSDGLDMASASADAWYDVLKNGKGLNESITDGMSDIYFQSKQAHDGLNALNDVARDLFFATNLGDEWAEIQDGNGQFLDLADPQKFLQVMESVAPAMDRIDLSFQDIANGAVDADDAVQMILDSLAFMDTRAGAVEAVNDALGGLDSGFETTAQKADRLRAALDNLFNPAANLIQANDDWAAGLAELDDSLVKTEQSLFAQTKAGRTNRGVIIDQAAALNDVIVKMAEHGRSTEAITSRYKNMRQALINNISAVTGNRREAKKLVDQLLLTPKEIETEFKLTHVDKVKNAAEDAKNKVRRELEQAGTPRKPPMDDFVRSLQQGGRAAASTTRKAVGDVKKALDFKAPKPDMSDLPTTVAAAAARARVIASTGGTSVGNDLKQGIINGFAGTASLLAAQAAAAVATAIAAARARARIHSPSKETEEIGQMLGLGLAVGLEKSTAAVEKAAKKQVERALRAYSKIAKDIDQTLSRISSKASKEFKEQHKDDIKRLQRLGKEYEKALQKLKDLVQKQRDFEKGVRDTIIQTGNPTTFDIISPDGIITGMQDAIAQAEAFRKVIARLVKEGLNKTTLQQILAAGPEAGLAVAESILDAGVDQVNDLQHQLQQTANDTGNLVGDHLFGSAIDNAQENIERLLKKLQPTARQLRKFAHDFVHALNAALDKEFGKDGGRNDHRNFARMARSADTSLKPDKQAGTGTTKNLTLNYYAPSGQQLSAEEKLFGAAKRARMVLK